MTELTSKKVLITLSVICLVVATFSGIIYSFFMRNDGNYRLLTVVSSSMNPTISPGEIVMVDTTIVPAELRTNYPDSDIIVFKKPTNQDELIIHRIVDKEERNGKIYFFTKGDGNSGTKYPDIPYSSEYDPWNSGTRISEDLVVGKIIDGIFPVSFVVIGFWVLIIVSIIVGISVLVLIIKNKLNSRKNKMRQLEYRISELEKEKNKI